MRLSEPVVTQTPPLKVTESKRTRPFETLSGPFVMQTLPQLKAGLHVRARDFPACRLRAAFHYNSISPQSSGQHDRP